ncbi:MAG: CPBP family intramembrane glutamic endopeptidase [Bacteroidia bacterium]
MRVFYHYVRQYFVTEVKGGYLLAIALLLTTCIILQYNFKLTNILVEHHRQELSYYPRAILLYMLPFGGTLLLYSAFYKKWDVWQNTSFVFLIFCTLGVYALRCGVTFHTEFINAHAEVASKSYWLKVSNQLVHGGILFLFPFIWWIFRERKQTQLYGWKYRDVLLRPYFIMLLCLVPLIIFASFQQDFLRAYPRFANTFKDNTGYVWAYGALFELSYGFDLAMNEFFFRGFIVLAFAKYLGRGVILPMVAFYVFIHFGKPLGETISSFFGGLVLGIIAYESKSILGGIIMHVGIAWMMELAAGIGRLVH